MKQHLSVFGLWARIHLGEVLCVLVLMVIFESVLFGWNLTHAQREAWDVPEDTGEASWRVPLELEMVLRGIPLISGVTFFTVVFLLGQGSDAAPNAGYTLRRLSVGEETGILWKALFNCLCLLLFWAVQVVAAVGLSHWYAASLPPEYRSGQTVFLAFYRVQFLHNLLPLNHWIRYLRNIVLLLALGFAAAVRTYKLRRGSRFGWGFILFLTGVAAAAFQFGIANWQVDVFVILVALCAAAVDAGYLYQGWRGTLDED